MAGRIYDASSIISIKNDRDRIRTRPTMYIPSTYADGALHLIFEVVDNSIDELDASGGETPMLSLSFDKSTYEAVVIDNGSGIPHEKLLDVFTVINTSGKFNNDESTAYTYSGGTYGVGNKAVCFLSSSCTVTSMRDGKYLTYIFKDGNLVETKRGKSKEHGTIVRFIIDKKLVEVDKLDPKDIKQRLYEKSFCFPDINMTYTLLDKGKEVKTITYSGNTLLDLVKKMNPDTTILEIKDTRKVKSLKTGADDNPELAETKVLVDAALSFKEDAVDADTDTFITSYANSIKTYDGGQHVEGFKAGVVKFFKDVLIPKSSKKDQDLQIMPSDITAGICGMVSVKLSKPEFSAQHKSRLTNQEVKFAVRDAVFDALCKLKASEANEIYAFVKRVAHGRLASKKVRRKDVNNAFSKDKPEKYKELLINLNTTWPELILCEGE